MAWTKKKDSSEPKAMTVILVPYHGGSIHQWRLPHWLLWGLAGLFLGSLSVAWWIITRHVEYEMARVEVDKLKQSNLKIAQELSQGRTALVQVAKMEFQLRQLLKFKTKKSLLQNLGQGGPSGEDEIKLGALLEKNSEQAVDRVASDMEMIRLSAADQQRNFEEIRRWVEKQRSLMACTPSVWPVRGWVSSPFGTRKSPFSGSETFHSGIDIANESGTQVKATADGKVIFAGWEGGYGKLVIVDHGNGIHTLYGHNSKLKVSAGQQIRRGTVLALMGSTGEATGPHCHYEVRLYGVAVNPMKYIGN